MCDACDACDGFPETFLMKNQNSEIKSLWEVPSQASQPSHFRLVIF